MGIVKHYHHSYHFSYTTSLKRHAFAVLVVIAIVLTLLFPAFHLIEPTNTVNLDQISPTRLLLASFFTIYRLFIAYLMSVVVAIPLAILITFNERLERILLPVFDVVQSVPILAFFPIIVLLFIKLQLFDETAIFVLFMAMLWNLVFSMIGGLKTIPQDVTSAAFVFGAKSWRKLWFVTLPAILPYIITGSLLAWGQGWSIVIVAEVLHNYIPGGNPSQDLFGLGSLLVNATYQGKNSVFLGALIVMILVIALMNFFIWQKLLRLTERYKFD